MFHVIVMHERHLDLTIKALGAFFPFLGLQLAMVCVRDVCSISNNPDNYELPHRRFIFLQKQRSERMTVQMWVALTGLACVLTVAFIKENAAENVAGKPRQFIGRFC